MTAHNEITGDKLTSGSSSDAFRDGWERIFGKKSMEFEPGRSTKISQWLKEGKAVMVPGPHGTVSIVPNYASWDRAEVTTGRYRDGTPLLSQKAIDEA